MFFFFQAEDGIRDGHVTGVQTCALPISKGKRTRPMLLPRNKLRNVEQLRTETPFKTGLMRESCACYEPCRALSFCSFALWLSRRNAPLPSSRTTHLTVAARCCVT